MKKLSSTAFKKGDPRLIGNQYAKGNKPNTTSFKKGEHHSPSTEFRNGLSGCKYQFFEGDIPWNKGRKCPDISEKQKGENNPMWGKTHTKEWAENHSRMMSGENHPNWKGGISEQNARNAAKIRRGLKSLNKKALERDGYVCVFCGSSERLEIDHIKPISRFPELVLDIENLRTLCRECHKLTETYGGRIKQLSYV